MPAALLSKYTVRRVIGESRLNRLLNAGWIAPVGSGQFDPRDVRKAITRLERERPPANKIEVARVRASEARNGHPVPTGLQVRALPGAVIGYQRLTQQMR